MKPTYEDDFREIVEHSLLYSKFERIAQKAYQEGITEGMRQGKRGKIIKELQGHVAVLREALKTCKVIFEKDYYFGHPTARKGISAIDEALASDAGKKEAAVDALMEDK